METHKEKYRCTFPKWVKVTLNGKPWAGRSEAMYGNSDGMLLADTYYSQLRLGSEEYFNTLSGLLNIWKLWKEERDAYVKLCKETNNPYHISDFFYKGETNKDGIVVTWGWINKEPSFLEEHKVSELKFEISMTITDVKVNLDDFTQIPK